MEKYGEGTKRNKSRQWRRGEGGKGETGWRKGEREEKVIGTRRGRERGQACNSINALENCVAGREGRTDTGLGHMEVTAPKGGSGRVHTELAACILLTGRGEREERRGRWIPSHRPLTLKGKCRVSRHRNVPLHPDLRGESQPERLRWIDGEGKEWAPSVSGSMRRTFPSWKQKEHIKKSIHTHITNFAPIFLHLRIWGHLLRAHVHTSAFITT